MKSQRDLPIMKSSLTLHLLLSGLFASVCVSGNVSAQTSVLFPLAQMTGTTNDTTITVRPINNPVNFRSQIYWLPPAGIQLRTTNGSATTNLIPNDYTVTIAGVPGSWRISVSDTNITLNAAEIGNLTTYTFTNSVPGVLQLIAGDNISLSPTDGKGVVTVSASGGGGGTATNAYQIEAGNKLITIVTNQTDFIYTISGVSQTNGYPWGVLYDAAGTARSATNGYPWGAFYDSAGSATASTNGWPWGVLYDPAGAAHAATNGYPWGTLYDAAGSATAATNGLSLASGLAAFRGTNTFAATNVATISRAGLVKVDGSSITVTSDGTISATTGGGGTVTSVNVAEQGYTSSGAITGSGTLTLTRTADVNMLGTSETNGSKGAFTNSLTVGAGVAFVDSTNVFQVNAAGGVRALSIDTNGNSFFAGTIYVNGRPFLDASSLTQFHHVGTGSTTNLINQEDFTGMTNGVAFTNYFATTNINLFFNGNLNSGLATNGPDLFFTFSGGWGSWSVKIPTNVTLHLPSQIKWMAGSNNVVTNGVLSFTAYGGTNLVEAALGENQ